MRKRSLACAYAHATVGTHRGRQALSLLLSLVLCLSLLPVPAGAAERLPIRINDTVNITDKDYKDIPEVSATDTSKDYSITFDNGTLTLENVTITGLTTPDDSDAYYTILTCESDINTIQLVGRNVIQGQPFTGPLSTVTNYRGIDFNGDMTIQGSSREDSLTITMPALSSTSSSDRYTGGITAESQAFGSNHVNLTIKDCTVDVLCEGSGSLETYAIRTKNSSLNPGNIDLGVKSPPTKTTHPTPRRK